MDCIFCQIIAGTIPSKKVYEDDLAVAFHDIRPSAPTHILVIPKQHIAKVSDMTEADAGVMGHLIWVAKQIAESEKLSGYKLQFNVGAAGGQVVWHVHLHLLGGWSTTQSEA